jgi:uncharacterized protein
MNESRPQFFGMLAGLFLAAGLVGSAMVATAAWVKVKNSQYISVKGAARKNIESDLAIWRGSYVVEAETLLEAQQLIQSNRTLVSQFISAAGVSAPTFLPVSIEELKKTKKDPEGWSQQRLSGYRLTQGVRVESTNVDTVARLDTTPLLEQGVVFTTEPPQFIYTSVAEAKLEMLAEAAKDARARAEQIATQGGRGIAQLHDADQGVFQITPRHESATSWQGENDTSAREKTITAVVTASFQLK